MTNYKLCNLLINNNLKNWWNF